MQLSLMTEQTASQLSYDSSLVERALNSSALAVDIETATDGLLSSLRDFGLSYLAPVTFVSLAFMDGEDMRSVVFSAPFDEKVQYYLDCIMRRELVTVFHNGTFDCRGLSKFSKGHVPLHIWDTMIMARLIHPELQENYGLLDVAKALNVEVPHWVWQMKKQRSVLSGLPTQDVKEYAAADAETTLKVYYAQCEYMGVIRERDFEHYQRLIELNDWECRAMRCYCQMAAVGVRLNTPYVTERIAELRSKAEALKKQLVLDGLKDLNSPKQRAIYIYQHKRIPVPDWESMSDFYTEKAHKLIETAKGKRDDPVVVQVFAGDELLKKQNIGNGRKLEPKAVNIELVQLSTSTKVLDVLCGHDEEGDGQPLYPEIKALSDFLAVDRMLATLETLLEHSALDGRLHSLVTPTTQTGRRKSTHPQVQNWKMKKASKDDPAGDMCGVAIGDTDDHTLIEIDYSNAENWIAAMLSGDDNLAAACSAEDFHSAMAAQYFGEQWERADAEERKRLRRLSKTITFGTAYGMGAYKLSVRNHISLDEAKALLAAKESAFPYVAETKRLASEAIKDRGFVTLWTGRRVMGRADYAGWNFCCQGGVGEMIKRSIVLITEEFERRKMKSRIALDMHDALIISVHHSEVDTALNIVGYTMEHIMPDENNQRTSPAITWIAQPDLEENAHKWGALQPIPAPAGAVIEEPIAEPPENGLITVADAPLVRDPVQNVTYRIPDLNFSYFIDFPLYKTTVQMTSDELHKVLAWLEAVDLAIADALTHLYVTCIPLDANGKLNYGNDGREIVVSSELQVHIDTWVQAPIVWATVAQYHNTEDLIGLNGAELRKEYERRSNWRQSLIERREITSQKYSNVLRILSKRVDDKFRAKQQRDNQHAATS